MSKFGGFYTLISCYKVGENERNKVQGLGLTRNQEKEEVCLPIGPWWGMSGITLMETWWLSFWLLIGEEYGVK